MQGERNTNNDHEGDVEGNDVDDEDVATPGGDHVEIGESAAGGDEEGAGVDGLENERGKEKIPSPRGRR